jgi:hypothetical protein
MSTVTLPVDIIDMLRGYDEIHERTEECGEPLHTMASYCGVAMAIERAGLGNNRQIYVNVDEVWIGETRFWPGTVAVDLIVFFDKHLRLSRAEFEQQMASKGFPVEVEMLLTHGGSL